MDLINNIIQFLKKNDKTKQDNAPEGVCPVCWGYQQYDGKIRTLLKDKQIDINNNKDSYTLIQDFMKNHIDGIKLQEGSVESCPTCGEEHDQ